MRLSSSSHQIHKRFKPFISRAAAPLRQVGIPILRHFLPGRLVFGVQETLVLSLILHFSPMFPGFCRPQPPCLLCHVQKFFQVLCQTEGLCLIALQHLPSFVHDEVWPPTSSHVRMCLSYLPDTCSSVAEALAWAPPPDDSAFLPTRTSSSSFLS